MAPNQDAGRCPGAVRALYEGRRRAFGEKNARVWIRGHPAPIAPRRGRNAAVRVWPNACRCSARPTCGYPSPPADIVNPPPARWPPDAAGRHTPNPRLVGRRTGDVRPAASLGHGATLPTFYRLYVLAELRAWPLPGRRGPAAVSGRRILASRRQYARSKNVGSCRMRLCVLGAAFAQTKMSDQLVQTPGFVQESMRRRQPR